MKHIQFILMALLCVPLFAQQTFIPDDNFEAYLEANGMGNGIANDDSVTTANIELVDTLTVNNLAIADMTGLEDFVSLEIFNCSWNDLTSLDLSGNPLLEYARCSNNELTTLNVSANGNLTRIFAEYNELTTVDVSNNPALTHFWTSINNVTELDVSNNPLLEKMSCADNSLTNLNISNNPVLWYLSCHTNALTSLDLRNGNNSILTAFSSTSNPNLSCIDVDDVAWADTALTNIDSWTSFSTDCATGGGAQTYVPDDNFESYLEANGMGNGIANDDSVTTANIDTVGTLNVENLGIADMTGLEDFSALAELYCNSNELTSLDVSANTALIELLCYSNQLTSLDVSTNTALNQLYCGSNQLTSLDVTTNTALTTLWCFSNQLTSLDMRNGNNTILPNFNSTENSDLICIDVDDSGWSDANWTWIDTWTSFSEDCSALDVSEESIIITEFKLHDAYPNPFNPTTTIRYDLPEASKVAITIYDLIGRKVRTLVNEQLPAGRHGILWNARNDMGSPVSAGVYIYTISADGFRDVKKMILLK